MPELTWFKDLSSIIQAAFATAAIMGAAIFAIFKLQLFRDFAPHLTISHTINHRPIGESYVHMDVTATLHNSSRVKVELYEGEFLLQEVAPVLDDQELEERLEARSSMGRNMAFGQWPIIGQAVSDWGYSYLTIEPGQTFQETIEFVISKEITTVVVQSFFYNSGHSEGSRKPESWGITSVYDIVKS